MKSCKQMGTAIAVLIFMAIGAQVTMTSTAFAADAPADLSVNVDISNFGRKISTIVCNGGNSHIKSFTLQTTAVNFVTETSSVITFGSSVTDPGTLSGGGWSGDIGHDECIEISRLGHDNGVVGDQISYTSTITSSTLGDNSSNVDPNSSNDSMLQTYTIVANPDLAMSTRLLTTDAINSGDSVDYEIALSNIGAGDYLFNDFNSEPGIYFVIPDGTTFTSISDTTPSDNLALGHINNDINNQACEIFGDVVALGQMVGADLSAYSGTVVHCQFDVVDDNFTSGQSGKFDIKVAAGTNFISGASESIGVVISTDRDTADFVHTEFTGGDFFGLPINNIFHLTYDASALIPTFTPCTGQGETTTVDDACFNISFNKTIYDPADDPQFTADSLTVTGGGHVSSFVKNGLNSWTVHITGMTRGQVTTVALTLAAVQDLSAISSGTQVLGINTIRFAAEDTENAENETITTLPETGNKLGWQIPVIFLELGAILLILNRRKKVSTL